jgi:hypothetical protein
MAILVSPGTSITIIDESNYASANIGSVPFVLLATAENKTFNGTIAPYTTSTYASKLVAVTSQRDLVTNFGNPIFQTSSAGTPLNAAETNEYGLMTAYSALGVCNLMYVLRADIDLNQLAGTAVRPIGAPANGTYWMNLSKSLFGIYEWNAVTQSYVNRMPLLISDASQFTLIGGVPTPNATVGTVGSYATVVASPYNVTFYKGSNNAWVQVGSAEWQNNWSTVSGTVVNPTITPGTSLAPNFTINTVAITVAGTSASLAASTINSAVIPGVTASVVNGSLVLYATAQAKSNGSVADGLISITDGTTPSLVALGITAGTYASPTISFGGYVSVPNWRTTDTTPRPSGSVWVKTSLLGTGANLVITEYNSSTASWTPISTPIYSDDTAAIYAMDSGAGGNQIQSGTIYIQQDALRNGTVSFRPLIRSTQGPLNIAGVTPTVPLVFTLNDSFTITATLPGQATTVSATITLGGVESTDLVSAVLAANIPNVTASVGANGAITFSHTQGGSLLLANVVGTPLTTAGFTSATTGVQVIPTGLLLSNFTPLIYTYASTTPYTAPADGTYWFYNRPLDVDIMINDTTGWKGYQTVSRDARGYNLVNTDPAGVILAPIAPTTQSDSTSLVQGDLWISTSSVDLVNFPVISRFNGASWVKIDNTDSVDQNGIVFADARWDATGTADPAAGTFPSITTLLTSNYVDLDCPDHRLYPRGALLFNTRRSGYNVKRYESEYFNSTSFPNVTLPAQSATWVTSSGLKNSGAPYSGAGAQRQMVVKALNAAIETNETLREESFRFNLIACPGYPELITQMVALNNDRANTAFTIGDTPMTLPVNAMDTTNWSNNATGTGLSTADPYMAVYYPSGLTTDLSGNTVVVPASHAVLRAAIKSDNVSYPWFAYAGTRRGLIDNMSDIGYVDAGTGSFVRNGIHQGMRDSLYTNNINPLTILPGVGITLWGNLTRSGTTTSMDRVNVARLVNYIRAVFAQVTDAFLFEPNDAITRKQISQVISSVLNDLVVKRGIYDYSVQCDGGNNTPAVIAANELYVDVAIEPARDVEYIYIPIRLMNPGAIKASGSQ